MDGNHPKRRKDKYNPYTIGTTGDGRHWLTFSDGQGNRHHFEISAAVFALFDSFELDDLSYLNEVDRHYEQSELMEASLYDRAVHRPATVEESALQSMEYAQLHRAISELPEIQKRRLIESTKSSALIRYLALANMRSWRCLRPSPIPSRASSIITSPVQSRRRTLMLISPDARHFLFMTPALRRNTAIS